MVEKILMITYSAYVANRERREQTGSKGSEQGAKGSEQGVKGSERSEQGVKGSKGSECISILGFRVPTTCGGKKFGDHLQCMSVPTTWN